jgi:hypothetical protein
MFILWLIVTAVILNDGSVVQIEPPREAAIVTDYATLKTCEDERRYIAAMMHMSDRKGESTTYHLECREARKSQL